MPSLIAQSIGLLVITFGLFALLGATLAGPKRRKPRAAFPAPQAFDEPEPELRRPEPVRYLDAAAEHFTVGVTAARPMAPERSSYAPIAPTTFETVPLDRVVAPSPLIVDDISITKRMSSLAVMTPESVEAAVQQAGSGLEPLRLDAARGAPDDLTVISGITEDQQKQLNAYGVYHFWQIAAWSPENVAWVASRVLSPHRIARENWMAQAAKLAGLKS